MKNDLRARLWIDTALVILTHGPSKTLDNAVISADYILNKFDAKFPGSPLMGTEDPGDSGYSMENAKGQGPKKWIKK